MVGLNMNKGGIWRRRGEQLAEGTYEVEQHSIQVMVWGAIGPNFRGELQRCPPSVNGESYIEMISEKCILSVLNDMFGVMGYWWQQDNAPAHRMAAELLPNLVKLLRWPPHSPDLSPIEHMWAIVKKRLRGRRFANEDELFAAMSEAWNAIPMKKINKLVQSFLARCKVCVDLGGHCLNGHWGLTKKARKEMDASSAAQ
jgi:hypothetical protein